jgi:hypothetical protein
MRKMNREQGGDAYRSAIPSAAIEKIQDAPSDLSLIPIRA